MVKHVAEIEGWIAHLEETGAYLVTQQVCSGEMAQPCGV